ncbi:MAG: S1 RNA-binding domain-containing protein [Chloroflexi bacterium]|nr:S1 RNA-binding domain-containing protein [Chloroflexota bacterium]
MAEPPDSFAALLAQADSVSMPRRGDLLRGAILSIDSQGAIVDLGLKLDGVIPRADLDRLPAEIVPKPGDKVAVMVVDPLDDDGNLVVSLAQARESGDWLDAQRLMESDAIVEAVPSGYNRGGLIVTFGRLRGFVPASHLTDLPRGLDEEARVVHLKQMVGRRMPFKVIEVDPQRQRLVLSERKAIRQWRQDQKGRVISELKEGEVRKGVVTSLREFGVFVDIGGADGLIHISELAWQRVEDPGQVVQVGQQVEAVIIRLDRQSNRIGLSLKRLQPNPWQMAAERYPAGSVCRGRVTRQTGSGTYVAFADGVEGVIRSGEGGTAPAHGSEVEVRVVSLDPERERLELELLPAAVGVAE